MDQALTVGILLSRVRIEEKLLLAELEKRGATVVRFDDRVFTLDLTAPPPEMLEQEVLCPHCGAQFRLRQKDSVEFKRKRQEEQEKKDAKSGKFWFNTAVIVGTLILIFVAVLIFMTAGK